MKIRMLFFFNTHVFIRISRGNRRGTAIRAFELPELRFARVGATASQVRVSRFRLARTSPKRSTSRFFVVVLHNRQTTIVPKKDPNVRRRGYERRPRN